MSAYIMASPGEPERIRLKTSDALLKHHLDWAHLVKDESFVDFGCASGEVLREVRRRGDSARVVGIDADRAMLDYAAEASRRQGLTGIEYVRALVTGPGSSELPGAALDHAWARYFLEYLPRPVEVIREMARVVRPGGKVTLVDIDGNCILHEPVTAEFTRCLDEVMGVLATTGFDPCIGSKLEDYARAAGLVDLRVRMEPYHWIVGRPDEATCDAWRRKIATIRHAYLTRLAPHDAGKATFFDDFLAHIMAEDTVTWSWSYLVQGTKP